MSASPPIATEVPRRSIGYEVAQFSRPGSRARQGNLFEAAEIGRP